MTRPRGREPGQGKDSPHKTAGANQTLLAEPRATWAPSAFLPAGICGCPGPAPSPAQGLASGPLPPCLAWFSSCVSPCISYFLFLPSSSCSAFSASLFLSGRCQFFRKEGKERSIFVLSFSQEKGLGRFAGVKAGVCVCACVRTCVYVCERVSRLPRCLCVRLCEQKRVSIVYVFECVCGRLCLGHYMIMCL